MVKTATDLGYLLWTRVTNCAVPYDALPPIPGVSLPEKPIPIDVFRRVTGPGCTVKFTLDEGYDLELSTAKVDSSSDKMLVRHIVATQSRKGVVLAPPQKVGDAAFYKPPRGKNSKARVRVQVTSTKAEWKQHLNAFASGLRTRYSIGVAGALDTQAVRRLVRSYLGTIGALYLDGPYFLMEREQAEPLRPLFDLLGDAGVMFVVPMPDTAESRAVLARSMETAISQGDEVNPEIWNRLEDKT